MNHLLPRSCFNTLLVKSSCQLSISFEHLPGQLHYCPLVLGLLSNLNTSMIKWTARFLAEEITSWYIYQCPFSRWTPSNYEIRRCILARHLDLVLTRKEFSRPRHRRLTDTVSHRFRFVFHLMELTCFYLNKVLSCHQFQLIKTKQFITKNWKSLKLIFELHSFTTLALKTESCHFLS